MKKLSDARIEAMSLAIAKAVGGTAGLGVADHGALVQETAAVLSRVFQGDKELDAKVRARIASLSRKVEEGSREWDLLYRQYSEELRRRA